MNREYQMWAVQSRYVSLRRKRVIYNKAKPFVAGLWLRGKFFPPPLYRTRAEARAEIAKMNKRYGTAFSRKPVRVLVTVTDGTR